MANILIGIHGLANKPPKDTLSEWWEAAIREGLSKNCDLEDADFRYEMVFWADLVHDPLQAAEGHRQPYIKAPPGPRARGQLARQVARSTAGGDWLLRRPDEALLANRTHRQPDSSE